MYLIIPKIQNIIIFPLIFLRCGVYVIAMSILRILSTSFWNFDVSILIYKDVSVWA